MKSSAQEQFWYGFNTSALILSFFFILFVPVVQGFEDFRQTVDIFLKAGSSDTDTFTNSTGTIATIHTTRRSEEASLALGTTTHVLAHDGYGTDATRHLVVLE